MITVSTPSPRRSPRSRPGTARAAAAAATVLLSLGLSGCSFTSRDVVLEPYSPGDGLGAELGDVAVRNLLVVSEGGGAPGVVSGTLASRSEEEVTMLVATAGTETLVTLAPHQSVSLGAEEGENAVEAVLDAVEPIAGDTIAVEVISQVAGGVVLNVPVVDPVREYATITPEPGSLSSADPSTDPGIDPSTGPSEETSATVDTAPTAEASTGAATGTESGAATGTESGAATSTESGAAGSGG